MSTDMAQCSLAHQLLPKNEHTRPEEDTLYLSPIIKQIEAERQEKEDLDVMTIKKKKPAKA